MIHLDSLHRPPTKCGPGRAVRNFCELGRLRAEIDGDEIAYTFLVDGENEEAHLRFGEIDLQARALGAKLQTLGVKGDRVLLLFHPGLEYISAFFGVLYAGFGVGAVAGAILMPTFNRLLSPDRANIWSMGLHAAATLIAALAMTPIVVGGCIAVLGACWITVMANNSTAVQSILPNFMRARGMAVHQMVFFGAMVVGSLFWGKIATLFGTQASLIVSAVSLVPATVLAASIRLPGSPLPRA